jgi:hypothetical protein
MPTQPTATPTVSLAADSDPRLTFKETIKYIAINCTCSLDTAARHLRSKGPRPCVVLSQKLSWWRRSDLDRWLSGLPVE